jgi:hypothetical protein
MSNHVSNSEINDRIFAEATLWNLNAEDDLSGTGEARDRRIRLARLRVCMRVHKRWLQELSEQDGPFTLTPATTSSLKRLTLMVDDVIAELHD